jgi:hypothetical protein
MNLSQKMISVSIAKLRAARLKALFPGHLKSVKKKSSIPTGNMIQKIPN